MLNYLRSLSPVRSISVVQLMKKLVMLLLLLSGHRGQTIHLLEVRNMSLSFSRATFQLGEPLKQQRPGKHVKELAFKGYVPDRRLWVVTVLKEYLKRTLMIQETVQQLILTCKKPIKQASSDTTR